MHFFLTGCTRTHTCSSYSVSLCCFYIATPDFSVVSAFFLFLLFLSRTIRERAGTHHINAEVEVDGFILSRQRSTPRETPSVQGRKAQPAESEHSTAAARPPAAATAAATTAATSAVATTALSDQLRQGPQPQQQGRCTHRQMKRERKRMWGSISCSYARGTAAAHPTPLSFSSSSCSSSSRALLACSTSVYIYIYVYLSICLSLHLFMRIVK